MKQRSGDGDLCGTEGAGYPSYAAGGEKIRNAIHRKKCVFSQSCLQATVFM